MGRKRAAQDSDAEHDPFAGIGASADQIDKDEKARRSQVERENQAKQAEAAENYSEKLAKVQRSKDMTDTRAWRELYLKLHDMVKVAAAAVLEAEKPRDVVRCQEQVKIIRGIMALPRHITVDRMLRVVLTSVAKTPRLLDCTPASLYESVLAASQLGLEPDGVLGQGYLIPYRNNKKGVTEARFQPGYRGLMALAWNSDQVAGVFTTCVYEGDEFIYRLGLNPVLDHVPCGESDQAKITHAYAVITTKNGGKVFRVMTRKQIDAVMATSQNSSGDSPWATDYAPMAEKSVLVRALKLAPVSVETQRAVEHLEAPAASSYLPSFQPQLQAPALPDGTAGNGGAPKSRLPKAREITAQGETVTKTEKPAAAGKTPPASGPLDEAAQQEAALEDWGKATEGLAEIEITAVLGELGIKPGELPKWNSGVIRGAVQMANRLKASKPQKGGK